MKRSKKWESGDDHDPDEEAQTQFQQLSDNEAMSLGVADMRAYKGKGTSLGKKNHALGKGKAKGKCKRQPKYKSANFKNMKENELAK